MDQPRFQQIDETCVGDHFHIDPDDECYFLFEYTSGKGYSFGQTNNLISNLKKSPTRKGRAEYRYKEGAIQACSSWFAGALNKKWLKEATLVPIPPSKKKGDPEYDDRITRICAGIPVGFAPDVRELVVQTESLPAAHEADEGARPTVDQLLAVYEVDESVTQPEPTYIAIVDDVVTAGVHFRAMHTILSERFPGVPIIGLFVARRVFPNDAAADAFADFLEE